MIVLEAIENAYFRALENNENYSQQGVPIWNLVFGDVQTELQPDNHVEVKRIDKILRQLADSYPVSD